MREFPYAIVVVYIPPSALLDAADDISCAIRARLQTQQPNAFLAISGDFNHNSNPNPTIHQFVKCFTGEIKALDLLYANVRSTYNSTAIPSLGRSDQNLVLLTASYTPAVR